MSDMDARDDERRRRPGTETKELRLHGSPASRARLVESGSALLRVQFRLWEHDLDDPHQPMIDYGFKLIPDRSGLRGKLCRFDASDGATTIIYGDAIVHGQPGHTALELDRATFAQKAVDIHGDFVAPSRAVSEPEAELLPHVLAWIGSYEQWVADRYGDGVRHRLIGLAGAASDYPARWWDLASQWRAMLAGGGARS